jgi:hypothetical protein
LLFNINADTPNLLLMDIAFNIILYGVWKWSLSRGSLLLHKPPKLYLAIGTYSGM